MKPTLPSSLSPPAPAADLVLAGDCAFRSGRVHEGCGRARQVLALLLAAAAKGPVIWAQPARQAALPFPAGIAGLVDPDRLLLVRVRDDIDLLWVLEEALRSGSVGLAVGDLAAPPGLTPVRRLQLAAEAGGGRTTGLLLTPEAGGAPGVESRWQLDPAPGGGWTAHRRRARAAPELRLQLVHGPDGRLTAARLALPDPPAASQPAAPHNAPSPAALPRSR